MQLSFVFLAVALVIVSLWTTGKCSLVERICMMYNIKPPVIDLPTLSIHINSESHVSFYSAALHGFMISRSTLASCQLNLILLTKGLTFSTQSFGRLNMYHGEPFAGGNICVRSRFFNLNGSIVFYFSLTSPPQPSG